MALESPRFRRNARLQQASSKPPSIRRGEQGEHVEILQQALIDLGFPMPRSARKSGIPDGIFGPETESKVKAFQAQQGLVPDGAVGPKTLARLDKLYQLREAAEGPKLAAEVRAPMPVGKWFIT